MAVNPSLKALVTIEELAAFLDRDLAALTQEAKDNLQRLINGVSAAVTNYCRAPLVKAAATEYYDGGSEKVVLRRAPVDTAAAFTVLEDEVAMTPAKDGSSKTASGDTPDYWLDPEVGVIERNGTWASGRRIVAVTYTAGRVTQTTTGGAARTSEAEALEAVDGPQDLREACLIVCKAHTDLGPANFGVHFTGEGGAFIRADAWPRTAISMLQPFIHMGG